MTKGASDEVVSLGNVYFVLTHYLFDDLIRLGVNENINPKKDCRLDTVYCGSVTARL